MFADKREPNKPVKSRGGQELLLTTNLAYTLFYSSKHPKYVFVSNDILTGNNIVEAHSSSNEPRNQFVITEVLNYFLPSCYRLYHPASKQFMSVSSEIRSRNRLVIAHPEDDTRSYFQFEDAGDGQFRLFCPAYNQYLFVSKCKKKGDNLVLAQYAQGDPRGELRYVPFLKMTGYIINFKFLLPPQELIDQHKEKQIFLEKRIITNPSDAELSEDISIEVTNQKEFNFSFKESLMFGAKLTIEAKFPLGGVNTELSSEVGFEAGQEITKSQTTSVQVKRTVTVGPHKSVAVDGYTNLIQGLEVPFTATLKLTGKGQRLINSGTLVDDLVDTEALICALKYNKLEAKIIGTQGQSVLAKVSGTFKGSYGVESVINAVNIE